MTDAQISTIVETVVNKSQNDLILLSVIILIGLVVVFIPFYAMYIKSRRQASAESNQEKSYYLDIIKGNTEAIVSLKSTLEGNNQVISNTLVGLESSSRATNKKIDVIDNNQKTMQGDMATFKAETDIAHQHCAAEISKVARTQERILNRVDDLVSKIGVQSPSTGNDNE